MARKLILPLDGGRSHHQNGQRYLTNSQNPPGRLANGSNLLLTPSTSPDSTETARFQALSPAGPPPSLEAPLPLPLLRRAPLPCLP